MRSREELIEELINNIYEVEDLTMRLEFNKGNYNNTLNVRIRGIFRSEWSKVYYLMRREEDAMKFFSECLLHSLQNARELYSYNEYLEDGKKINTLCKYITSVTKNNLKDRSEEGFKREVLVKGGKKEYPNYKMYSRDDESGLGDYLIEMYGIVEGEDFSNPFHKNFKNKYKNLLTRNQRRIYDTLKDSFNGDTSELGKMGYKGVGDLVEDRGITEKSYVSFKKNVKRRIERKVKNYKEEMESVSGGESMMNVVSSLIEILEDVDMSDEEIEFLFHRLIAKYYSESWFEVKITRDLTRDERVELVRLVNSFQGIEIDYKEGRLKGVENISYLSNKAKYKIINVMYEWRDGYEERR